MKKHIFSLIALVLWSCFIINEAAASIDFDRFSHEYSESSLKDICVAVQQEGDATMLEAWRNELMQYMHDQPLRYDFYIILGWLYKQQNEHEKARAAFQRAVDQSCVPALSYDGLGWVLINLGRHREAKEALLHAIKHDKKNYGTYVGLSYCYRALKEYAEAERVLREALHLQPDSAWVQFELGLCFKEQEKYDEAISVFQRIREREPKHVRACLELGDIYLRRKEYENAHEAFSVAIARDAASVVALDGLGWVLIGMERYEEARKCFLEALTHNNKRTSSYVGLWRYHRSRQEYEVGEQRLREALTYAPDSAQVNFELGICLKKQGKYDEAIAVFQRVRERDPGRMTTYQELASLYRKQRRYIDMLETCIRGLKIDAENQSLISSLIAPISSLGLSNKDVEQYLKKGMAEEPQWYGYYVALGWQYVHANDIARAEAVFSAGLSHAPESVDVYAGLAECYKVRRRQREYMRLSKQAVAMFPENKKSYVLYAEALLTRRQYAQALDAVSHARMLDPRFVDAHVVQAKIYQRKRDYVRAEELLRNALDIVEEKERIYVALGELFLEYDKACRVCYEFVCDGFTELSEWGIVRAVVHFMDECVTDIQWLYVACRRGVYYSQQDWDDYRTKKMFLKANEYSPESRQPYVYLLGRYSRKVLKHKFADFSSKAQRYGHVIDSEELRAKEILFRRVVW